MKSYRKSAISIGILFIIATLTPVVSGVFLIPMANASDLLAHVAVKGNDVIFSVLLELIMITAIVGIAVVIFPILKTHNETLAIAYLSSRIVEVIAFVMGTISLVLLPALSQQYAQAGASDASLLPLGNLVLNINDWTYVIAGQIIFSLTALVLNIALYQAKLVPRWLSGWGLIGVPLMLAAGVLELFGITTTATLFAFLVLPLALQEMVFAVWLMVRGFSANSLDVEANQAESSRRFRTARAS